MSAVATALRILADEAGHAERATITADASSPRPHSERRQDALLDSVLGAIQELRLGLRRKMQEGSRIIEDAIDRDRTNAAAMLHNSHIGLRQRLEPLVSTTGAAIPGFLATPEAMGRLKDTLSHRRLLSDFKLTLKKDRELNAILVALGESDGGPPSEKLRRL